MRSYRIPLASLLVPDWLPVQPEETEEPQTHESQRARFRSRNHIQAGEQNIRVGMVIVGVKGGDADDVRCAGPCDGFAYCAGTSSSGHAATAERSDRIALTDFVTLAGLKAGQIERPAEDVVGDEI